MNEREKELLPQIIAIGLKLPQDAQEILLAYGNGMADLLSMQAAQQSKSA